MAEATEGNSDSSEDSPSDDFLLHQYLWKKTLSDEDEKSVETLLRNIKDVNVTINTRRGNSSFMHLAVRNGHLNVAKSLIDRGSKLDSLDGKGFTPLKLSESMLKKHPSEEKYRKIWEFLTENIEIPHSSKEVIEKLKYPRRNGVLSLLELEHGCSFLEDSRFYSALEKLDDLFFIDVDLKEFDEAVDEDKLLKMMETLEKEVLIQIKSPKNTIVFVKENKRCPFVLNLNDPNTTTVEENFRSRLLKKESFGFPIMVEGFKNEQFGSFSEDDNIRSLLKVEFKQEERFILLEKSIEHGYTLVTKYLSIFDWDFAIQYKGRKNILHRAIESGSLNTLAAILKTSLAIDKQIPSHELHQILERPCTENGDTLLMVSTRLAKPETVRFLLQWGAEINERNTIGETAADIAWNRKHYSLLLELLNFDSYFPMNFDDLQTTGNEEGKQLMDFIQQRNQLHDALKVGNMAIVEESIAKNQSRYYLNTKNESACYVAIKHKQWSTYAHLRSIGVEFPEQMKAAVELTREERNEIDTEMEKYYVPCENSHLLRLMSVSRFLGNPGSCSLGDLYQSPNKIKYVSYLLKVAQNVTGLSVIFDTELATIERLGLMWYYNVFGLTLTVAKKIYVGARPESEGGRPLNEVQGTLIHELTHMAMLWIYENHAKPYNKEDTKYKEEFQNITNRILTNVIKSIAYGLAKEEREKGNILTLKDLQDYALQELGSKKVSLETITSSINEDFQQKCLHSAEPNCIMDNILVQVFQGYEADCWHAELIVRIPHMLTVYGEDEGKKLIKDQVPDLFQYFEEKVIPDIKKCMENSWIDSHQVTTEVLNNCSGEMERIKNSSITLNSRDYTPYIKEYSNVKLLFTSSTLLCTINVYQEFRKRDKHASHTSIICNYSYFKRNKSTVLNAVTSKACKYLIVIYDFDPKLQSISFADLETASNPLKDVSLQDKVLIFPSSCYEDRETVEMSFQWDDLIQSSKEYLLRKEVRIKGRLIKLEDIIDRESAKSVLTAESLAYLVEHSVVEIGGHKTIGSEGLENDHYVEKVFSMKVFDGSVLTVSKNKCVLFLSNIKREVVAFVRKNEKDVKEWDDQELPTKSLGTLIFISKSTGDRAEIESEFSKLCKNLPEDYSAHWIDLRGTILIWEKTVGDISQLFEFTNTPLNLSRTQKDMVERNDDVVLLAADPGMGKSTLISQIISKEQQKYAFRFDLNDYADDKHPAFLGNIDFRWNDFKKAMDFIFKMTCTKTSLERDILLHLCRNTNLVVFYFDGFDEICPQYRENVIELLKSLRKHSKSQLWVTTRFGEKEYLEKELSVLAHTLLPLTIENQSKIMNHVWRERLLKLLEKCHKMSDWNEVDETLKKMRILKLLCSENAPLKELHKSISKLEKDHSCPNILYLKKLVKELNFTPYCLKLSERFKNLMEVPMHANILAHCVFEECFQDVDSLNLSSIYEVFIQKKFERYYEKCKCVRGNQQSYAMTETFQKSFLNYHKVAAVNAFYDAKKVIGENTRREQVLSVGFMTLRNGVMCFIHRSFAEYFFSLWMCENPDLIDAEFMLQNILIDTRFAMVRRFLEGRSGDLRRFFCHVLMMRENVLLEILIIITQEGLKRILNSLLESLPDQIKLLFMEGNLFFSILMSSHPVSITCVIDFLRDNMDENCPSNVLKNSNWFQALAMRNLSDCFEKFWMMFMSTLGYTYLENHFIHKHINTIIALQYGGSDFVKNYLKTIFSHIGEKALLKLFTECDEDGFTLLHMVCSRGDLGIFQQVCGELKRKLKEDIQGLLEKRTKSNQTILHVAACRVVRNEAESKFFFSVMKFCEEILQRENFRSFLNLRDCFERMAIDWFTIRRNQNLVIPPFTIKFAFDFV